MDQRLSSSDYRMKLHRSRLRLLKEFSNSKNVQHWYSLPQAVVDCLSDIFEPGEAHQGCCNYASRKWRAGIHELLPTPGLPLTITCYDSMSISFHFTSYGPTVVMSPLISQWEDYDRNRNYAAVPNTESSMEKKKQVCGRLCTISMWIA